MRLSCVDDWSVVRLPDGRVGRFHRKGPGNRPVVILAGEHGVQMSLSDEVEVVAYPAQLARRCVEALLTCGDNGAGVLQ